MESADRLSLIQASGNLKNRLLPHAIRDKVGRSVTQDTWAQSFLPVVIMCQPAQRSLDASQYDGNIGVELT